MATIIIAYCWEFFCPKEKTEKTTEHGTKRTLLCFCDPNTRNTKHDKLPTNYSLLVRRIVNNDSREKHNDIIYNLSCCQYYRHNGF